MTVNETRQLEIEQALSAAEPVAVIVIKVKRVKGHTAYLHLRYHAGDQQIPEIISMGKVSEDEFIELIEKRFGRKLTRQAKEDVKKYYAWHQSAYAWGHRWLEIVLIYGQHTVSPIA